MYSISYKDIDGMQVIAPVAIPAKNPSEALNQFKTWFSANGGNVFLISAINATKLK